MIARANLARAAGGYRFDAAYAALLSADAVPTLVAALHRFRRGSVAGWPRSYVSVGTTTGRRTGGPLRFTTPPA